MNREFFSNQAIVILMNKLVIEKEYEKAICVFAEQLVTYKHVQTQTNKEIKQELPLDALNLLFHSSLMLVS